MVSLLRLLAALLTQPGPCGAASAVAAAAKPGEHCRLDLPGCCPKELKHVFFLHIEKTGGTHTRGIIKEAVSARLKGAYACNYVHQAAYDCLPTTEEVQRPWCNRMNMGYYRDFISTGRHFTGKCALTAGHHDMKMFEAFPAALQPHTLLVTNLREPLARLVSHYHMLRRFNYTPAYQKSITELFVGYPNGVARTRDKQTRMVAGEFCCANGSAIRYGDPGLLDKALRNMERFCVVGLTERMGDTLAYLHFVLGLPYAGPPVDTGAASIREYDKLDAASAALLKSQNMLDVQLFQAVVRRFDEQMQAMRRAIEAGQYNSTHGALGRGGVGSDLGRRSYT